MVVAICQHHSGKKTGGEDKEETGRRRRGPGLTSRVRDDDGAGGLELVESGGHDGG